MTLTTPTDPTADATVPRDRLDRLVSGLVRRKDDWIRVPIASRVRLLRQAVDGLLAVSDEWVRQACRHRSIDPESPLAGEEWIAGPMTTIRNLRLLIDTLEHQGSPTPPGVRVGPDGQTIVKVFPRSPLDRFLFYNMSAEIWIEPGKPPTQGRIYRDHAGEDSLPTGQVALVLGAGNVSSIGPLDVVHKLFAENQVVLLKTNPVNAYLGPLVERAFAGLIDEGFLAVVGGGPEIGSYLCRHDEIDTIHLTGSDRTYDAIVWGSDPQEQARRKASADPVVDKSFTAELGCVTPILVVPGTWSSGQLDFQARHVASMVAHNASFNCTAGKVLVTAKGWPERDEFVSRVRRALAATPPRVAYYPGAEQRHRAFLEHYPQAELLGSAGEGVVPWTLIPGVSPDPDEYALRNEAFCGILASVDLDTGDDAGRFLDRSVDFANECTWGTLSAVMLIDGKTQAERHDEVERAIGRLRYGNVGVNAWTGVNFGLGVTSWGAFPGHTPQEIGSGTGFVHNSFLLDHPQKSVVLAPFRMWPKPVWFADHQNLHVLGRWLVRFEAHHTPWNLAGVALAGLKS